MADRSMDFTGNNDWAAMGKTIDPEDHPANNMPSATEDHWGTELSTTGERMGAEGYKATKKYMKQGDSAVSGDD